MKWYSYVICSILIFLGVFFGISLYRDIKAESYVNGSIDISNKFSEESFNYSSTSVVFYHDLYDDSDTYSFQTDLLKVKNFDGNTKEYQVWLNGFYLIDSTITAGSVYSVYDIDFYNEYGSLINNSKLYISIKFLSSKTELTLSTTGQENAQFLEQYFSDNGIRLSILEIL